MHDKILLSSFVQLDVGRCGITRRNNFHNHEYNANQFKFSIKVVVPIL